MNRTFAALALGMGMFGAASAGEAGGFDGFESAYGEYLTQVLRRWVPARSSGHPKSLEIACVATPRAEGYIGMVQRMTIEASAGAVASVLDDVDHFKDLFPDTVDVRIVAGTRSGPRYVSAWLQRPPFFFMPDIAYELSHLVDKTMPGRWIYRYKLLRGDELIASDGLVVLDALGPTTTLFTEYDFFNGQWGLVPNSVVWQESLRGAFHSDVAVKLRAEHADWSYADIAKEAKRLTSAHSAQLAQCYEQRKPVLPVGEAAQAGQPSR